MTPKEIEAASFNNLVEWNRDDLLRVIDGERVTEVFTEHQHSHLKRHGVLSRIPNKRISAPTSRAMEILMPQNIATSAKKNE